MVDEDWNETKSYGKRYLVARVLVKNKGSQSSEAVFKTFESYSILLSRFSVYCRNNAIYHCQIPKIYGL